MHDPSKIGIEVELIKASIGSLENRMKLQEAGLGNRVNRLESRLKEIVDILYEVSKAVKRIEAKDFPGVFYRWLRAVFSKQAVVGPAHKRKYIQGLGDYRYRLGHGWFHRVCSFPGF